MKKQGIAVCDTCGLRIPFTYDPDLNDFHMARLLMEKHMKEVHEHVGYFLSAGKPGSNERKLLGHHDIE